MSAPTIDPALCVELGRRVVTALNTEADWASVLDRLLYWIDSDAPVEMISNAAAFGRERAS